MSDRILHFIWIAFPNQYSSLLSREVQYIVLQNIATMSIQRKVKQLIIVEKVKLEVYSNTRIFFIDSVGPV